MRTLFCIIFSFTVIFSAKSQLLWEISGNGAKKSYILGTHHLVSADFLDSVQNVYKAYNSSQIVVGEILLSAKNISDTIMAYATMPKGTSLSEMLSKQEFEQIDVALQNTLFIPLENITTLKPAMISAMYVQAIFEKLFKKKDEFLLDSYFQHIAEMSEKKVLALESATEQSVLLFGNQSLERQKELLLATIQDSAKLAQEIIQTVKLYKDGNLDAIYSEYINDTGKTAPTLREKHDLLDSRNEKWAKKISEIIKKESAFIVVGALHLPAENGLLNLLKKAGYKVKKF